MRDWGDAPITKGAAWLALQANVPMVPVAIWGTQHAMPLDKIRVRRAPIQVVVGCPLTPNRFRDRPDPVAALTRAASSALDRELRFIQSGVTG